MDEVEAPPIVERVGDVVVEAVPCRRCGRSLLGLRMSDVCPGCKAPVSETTGEVSIDEASCMQCGYSLRGLREEGVCPECGTPIERSLRGNLLRYCSIEYVQSLRRGAWMVLASIVVQFVLFLFSILLVGVVSLAGAAWSLGIDLATNFIGVVAGFMSLYGWWLLSALDPAYSGRDEGTTSRRVLRWAVALGAGYAVMEFVYQAVPGLQFNAALGWMGIAMGLASLMLTAVQFFASMLYLRWLAPRLPNVKVYGRAKQFMWLGPLLVTVGAVCLGLGVLVAIVMYWNMMYWLYKDLVAIEERIAMESVG